MSTNIYASDARKVREYTEDALFAKLVPFIRSSPGMGKSSIVRAISDYYNLELIDIRLSTCAPEDMSGLPEFYDDAYGQRRARFVPFSMFPLEFDKLPKGKDGWLIFYDEANSGTKMVQAASYKVVLDRMIGQSKLHDRVVQCMAGNLDTDRAIVENLSTAMQSRLVHLELELSHRIWLEDVAYAQQYDERIIAFLNYDDEKLMDFKPDHNEKTFCCPRTWEFMNKLIKGKQFGYDANGRFEMQDKTPLYAGTITSGVAAEFVQFCAMYRDLITADQVLADPENAQVPAEAMRRWAITTKLLNAVSDEKLDPINLYISRMDLSFQIMFFRGVMAKHKTLRSHPAMRDAMTRLANYLHG